MAKVQKTFLLNDELVRMLDADQRTTGVSFTRVVTAALLQYYFQDPEGPNPVWMEDAVGLEIGEFGLGEMPKVRQQIEAADAQAAMGWCGGDLSSDEFCNQTVKTAKRRIGEWKKMMQIDLKDDVQKIIEYRTQLRKRGADKK